MGGSNNEAPNHSTSYSGPFRPKLTEPDFSHTTSDFQQIRVSTFYRDSRTRLALTPSRASFTSDLGPVLFRPKSSL